MVLLGLIETAEPRVGIISNLNIILYNLLNWVQNHIYYANITWMRRNVLLRNIGLRYENSQVKF